MGKFEPIIFLFVLAASVRSRIHHIENVRKEKGYKQGLKWPRKQVIVSKGFLQSLRLSSPVFSCLLSRLVLFCHEDIKRMTKTTLCLLSSCIFDSFGCRFVPRTIHLQCSWPLSSAVQNDCLRRPYLRLVPRRRKWLYALASNRFLAG